MLLTDFSLTTTPTRSLASSDEDNSRHSYLFWKRHKSARSSKASVKESVVAKENMYIASAQIESPCESERAEEGRRGSKTSVTSRKSGRSDAKRRRPSSDDSFLDARPMVSKSRKRQGIVFVDESIIEQSDFIEEDGQERTSLGDIRVVETFAIVEEPSSPPSRTRFSSLVNEEVEVPRSLRNFGSAWKVGRNETSDSERWKKMRGGREEGYLDHLAEKDPALYNAVVAGDVEYILLDHAQTFLDEMTAYIK